MTAVIALIVSSSAFGNQCRGFRVDKDRESTVSITAIVRSMGGPAVPLRLELHGTEARLVAAPQNEGATATPDAPGVFTFEGGAREAWMPVPAEQAASSAAGEVVFVLDDSQLALLSTRPLTQVILPIGSERGLVAGPDKENQQTLLDGARCIVSRTAG